MTTICVSDLLEDESGKMHWASITSMFPVISAT